MAGHYCMIELALRVLRALRIFQQKNFTSDFGKVNGIVYGGTSRKVKNYLQLTNKIYLNYVSKSDNRIGYFKTELIEAFAPRYFNNKNKILCLNSITSILRILLPIID